MRHDTRRRLIRGAAATTTLGAFGVPQFAFAQGVQGAQVAPVRGGQLIVGSPGRPRHFNPALQSGSPMMPGAQLFASPLLIDRNWKPRP
jgi:peptide/nickel transport system substrate-binding protein